MTEAGRPADEAKRIALVAHDARKADLIGWMGERRGLLVGHRFWTTGTTGRLVRQRYPDLDVTALKSGPLGGDQQIGALIADGRIDALFFFIDPMSAQPHDVDVKALTRLAILYDVPMACNRATADMVITSPLFARPRPAVVPDTSDYDHRPIPSIG